MKSPTHCDAANLEGGEATVNRYDHRSHSVMRYALFLTVESVTKDSVLSIFTLLLEELGLVHL